MPGYQNTNLTTSNLRMFTANISKPDAEYLLTDKRQNCDERSKVLKLKHWLKIFDGVFKDFVLTLLFSSFLSFLFHQNNSEFAGWFYKSSCPWKNCFWIESAEKTKHNWSLYKSNVTAKSLFFTVLSPRSVIIYGRMIYSNISWSLLPLSLSPSVKTICVCKESQSCGYLLITDTDL